MEKVHKDILKFWFGENDEYLSGLWWHGIHKTIIELRTFEKLDMYIKENWEDTFEKISNLEITNKNYLDNITDKNELVSMMILFGQFSRHMYRGKDKAFKFDEFAVNISRKIEKMYFNELSKQEKIFMYVTLMNSENICDINDAILGLLLMLQNETNKKWKEGIKKILSIGEEHAMIMEKFGRYPHRNNIIGRISSIEEIDYLSKKIPFWMKSTDEKKLYEKEEKKEENEVKKKNIIKPWLEKKNDFVIKKESKLKILVLHGMNQNGENFKLKTEKYLGKELCSIAELIYIDGTYPSKDNEGKEWWKTSYDIDKIEYVGIEKSLEYIDELFSVHKFDGILGFSQGAIFGGVISGLIENKNDKYCKNIKKTLKFVILISGIYCRDVREDFKNTILESSSTKHEKGFINVRKNKIMMPSFHIWGENDKISLSWMSEILASAFDEKMRKIFVHKKGHFKDSIKYWPVKEIYEWLKEFIKTESDDEILHKEEIIKENLKKIKNNEIDLNNLNSEEMKEILENMIMNKYECEIVCDVIKKINYNDLLNLFNEKNNLWKYLIEYDTNYSNYSNNDSFLKIRRLTVELIGNQLCHEYNKYIKNKDLGIPSELSKFAPKYNKSYRTSRLYHDLSMYVGSKINIFNDDKKCICEPNEKRQLLLSYNQYRQIVSKLSNLSDSILNNKKTEKKTENKTDKIDNKRQNIFIGKLEEELKKPLSDYILNPKAEPVDISSPILLEPLYDFLQNKEIEKELENEMIFEKGTVCTDGRLDLCKQVIGPNGVNSLINSLKLDSLMKTPKVKHLLLGNNVCGNNLGFAVAEFIKSGKSSLTTWYIAGNDMDHIGIEPIAEALEKDNKVTQLWLKRNPLKKEGMFPLVKMLKINTYLQVLDLTNTGILDDGAKILLEGIKINNSLKFLYLSSNGLTEKTCETLKDTLTFTNIEQLGLGCNRLGNNGAILLSEILLQKDVKLKSLEIASCAIGIEGANAIAKALEINKSLVMLNMGFLKSTNDLDEIPNLIESEGAISIANALLKNNKLRYLDLTYSGIEKSGINRFSKILEIKNTERNCTLLYLNLEQSGINNMSIDKEIIKKSLEYNRSKIDRETFENVNNIINPPHLKDIQSVYRIA